jgi:predicted nucleotidyltransferase
MCLVDVSHPIRAVVPTLDGPVLEVLARVSRPLSGREVHRIAGVGSENGIRLALARLVDQGVVRAEERRPGKYYAINRSHLAWPAVERLTSMRAELLSRLREAIAQWQPQPEHASLFGSTARGEGTAHSDIDVLLVRPSDVDDEACQWVEQVDCLRVDVEDWTGNHAQVLEMDFARLAEHERVGDRLIDEIARDSVTLAGVDLHVLLREPPAAGVRR